MNSYDLSKNSRRRCQAFTLLEMLVVLVLVSLIVTFMLEGLSYTLSLRERFSNYLAASRNSFLIEHWFRESTANLFPVFEDIEKDSLFEGKTRRLSGLTLAGLDAQSGVPVPFTWELTFQGTQTVLSYKTARQQEWPILEWSGEAGGFQYLSEDDQWHETWPVEESQTVVDYEYVKPQLPKAIAFSGIEDGHIFKWVVAVRGKRKPLIDYQTTEGAAEQ